MIIVRIVRVKRAIAISPNMFHLQIMWKLGTLITQQFLFFRATSDFLQNFDKKIFLQFLLLRHWYGWIEDIVTWNRELMKIGQKFIVADHFYFWPVLDRFRFCCDEISRKSLLYKNSWKIFDVFKFSFGFQIIKYLFYQFSDYGWNQSSTYRKGGAIESAKSNLNLSRPFWLRSTWVIIRWYDVNAASF